MVSENSYEQAVVDALAAQPRGLTLNEVRARCGGSVSATSKTLVTLERQGRGHFRGGRWTLRGSA